MWCENLRCMFFRYVTKHACDRQMDKQTDGHNYDPQDRASIAASRSKNEQLHDVCYDTAYDAFVTFLFNACSAHILP